VIERLFRAWLSGRGKGERIQSFFTRHADEELIALGAGTKANATVSMEA
jgi:hypothetical protein